MDCNCAGHPKPEEQKQLIASLPLIVETLTLISSRLDLITDEMNINREELKGLRDDFRDLYTRSERFFREMKEQFLQDIIKQEVELYRQRAQERARHMPEGAVDALDID